MGKEGVTNKERVASKIHTCVSEFLKQLTGTVEEISGEIRCILHFAGASLLLADCFNNHSSLSITRCMSRSLNPNHVPVQIVEPRESSSSVCHSLCLWCRWKNEGFRKNVWSPILTWPVGQYCCILLSLCIGS